MIGMTWPQYRRCEVAVSGRVVKLSPQAADLIAFMLIRRGHALSRGELVEMLWPNPDREPEWAERQIDVLIHRTRRLIGFGWIEGIWGRGYRLVHDHEFAEGIAA